MKNQQGFTLIELVMVIVILGILAATALPKFASLQGDARGASIDAASGSMKSAMAIVHAQSILEGEEAAASGSVTLEGTAVATAYGYPTAASISAAAGLGSDDYTNSSGTITITGYSGGTCQAVYTAATSATSPASVSVDKSGC